MKPRHNAETALAEEWWAMAAELIKSADALESHAATLRERARIATERAQLIMDARPGDYFGMRLNDGDDDGR